MSTVVRAAGLTDVGRARERNEDAWFSGTTVFAVADGLGGHRAGEVASDLALESLRALDATDPKKAASHIAEAVRKGNRAVHARASGDPELKGMGTTMTAVAIHDGIAHLAHVGDSRCYLIRDREITQMSRDHTLVARMVDEGRLTVEQAESHPQRSVLTRALGPDRDVDVQTQNVVLAAGDRLLLCSDGLSGVLADEDLLRMAGDGGEPEEVCRALVDEANARGGPDNITVVIVDVVSAPAKAPGGSGAGTREPRPFPIRAAVWTGVAAGVLLIGLLAFRTWATSSYYVGEKDGKVTIFRGVPGVPLGEVAEPTDLEVSRIDSPSIRRSLEDGIRAASLDEARRIVDQQIAPNVDPPVGPPEIPVPRRS